MFAMRASRLLVSVDICAALFELIARPIERRVVSTAADDRDLQTEGFFDHVRLLDDRALVRERIYEFSPRTGDHQRRA